MASACFGAHMQIIELMLRYGATDYMLLEMYCVDVDALVYDWSLPLSILQKISVLKFEKICNAQRKQRRIYDTLFIVELGRIVQDYVVC